MYVMYYDTIDSINADIRNVDVLIHLQGVTEQELILSLYCRY